MDDKDDDNDECQEKLHQGRMKSPDIDNGWAIAIAAAVFFNFVMFRGISYSSSVFYIIFLDEFEETPSSTAWIVTIQIFCTAIFCPLVNVLLTWMSCRTLMAVGCVLSSCGLFASSFAYSLPTMMISFGFLTGFGWCIVNFLNFILIADYFIKYRALAISIASTGVAIGQFICPPVLQFLFNLYQWRGSFIVLAALNLNLLISAAMAVPPRGAETQETMDMEAFIAKEPSTHREKNTPKKKENMCNSISNGCKHQIAPIKDIYFTFYLGAALIFDVGIQGYQTHIGNYNRVTGSTESQTTFLISFIGLGSFLCRCTIGAVLRVTKSNPSLMFIIYVLLASLVSFLVLCFRVFHILAILTFLFGFATGAAGIQSEIVIAIIGRSDYGIAIGQMLFVCAIGGLLGGPVVGWLYELDPSYRLSFVSTGIMFLLASGFTVPGYIYSKAKVK